MTLLPTPRATRGGSHTETVALLPTPMARDWKGYGPGDLDRNDPSLSALPLLLPTPRATDGTKGGPNQRGSSGDLMLPSAVTLLPTPSVADVEGGRKHRSGARSDELLLNGIAASQDWRQYDAAIRRAEQATGRPAPPPTETMLESWLKAKERRLNSHMPVGMRGSIRFLLEGPKQRLSARFVEWLMMLPAGHVTDVPGLSRNDMLKALGNGVVPAQAAAAVRAYLTDEAVAS